MFIYLWCYYQYLGRISHIVYWFFRILLNSYLSISAFSFFSLLCVFSISLAGPGPLYFLISDLVTQGLDCPLGTDVPLTQGLDHLSFLSNVAAGLRCGAKQTSLWVPENSWPSVRLAVFGKDAPFCPCFSPFFFCFCQLWVSIMC